MKSSYQDGDIISFKNLRGAFLYFLMGIFCIFFSISKILYLADEIAHAYTLYIILPFFLFVFFISILLVGAIFLKMSFIEYSGIVLNLERGILQFPNSYLRWDNILCIFKNPCSLTKRNILKLEEIKSVKTYLSYIVIEVCDKIFRVKIKNSHKREYLYREISNFIDKIKVQYT